MAYTTRAKLDAKFGSINIDSWADLNGNEDEDEIDAAVEQAIADAEGEVNLLLRGGIYAVPFTGTIPVAIQTAATILAAALLFTNRGVIDTGDGESNVIQGLADTERTKLHQIKAGRILLEIPTDYASGPKAVND